jgi:16S rRNA pseudouridine516 synthase
MRIDRWLANLGYGSRRAVLDLLDDGRLRAADGAVLGRGDRVPGPGATVDGAPVDPSPPFSVLLHKPVGYVCSTQDPGETIYALLPPRFGGREPALSPVGRLDKDTSGLLLLTDDGTLNHRLTHPKRHVPRRYEAVLARPLSGEEAAVFASGTLLLHGETTPCKPARLEPLGSHRAAVWLTEGRYHQVRRMFAALGNHVDALHRSHMGGLGLDGLAAGAWRPVDAADLTRCFAADE